MTEFWENSFQEKQEMWGLNPTNSALLTATMFADKEVKKVLIPGIGYGRNAQAFINKGMEVTGIEISATAIEMAAKHYTPSVKIYHGSVTDMPFDSHHYDGIFSHALIHLLDKSERAKLISDCYHQLTGGGYMVFTAISRKAPTYGQGKLISKDRFEQFGGVNIFFYDEEAIQEEFGPYGLFQVEEIVENYPFYLIKCRK